MKYILRKGESMENQLSKKQKRVLLLVGVTGAVYLSFKYLLPLVIPFLIAYVIALGIRPVARFIHRRFRIKESLAAVGMIILLVVFIFGTLWFVGRQLLLQAARLINDLPVYLEMLNDFAGDFCSNMEKSFYLEEGVMMEHLYDMGNSLAGNLKERIMPFLMGKSMPIFKWVMEAVAVIIITITATLLSVKEIDHFRYMKEHSSFRTEITLVSRRLSMVGGAYLKAQGVILSLTIMVCTGGFMLLGNTYSILLGVLIGLLDALPIFGTGTVLIPWAFISAMGGNVYQTVILSAVYLTCNFMREILEAKLMGKSMGISALESLMAMYIGLQLFGIVGLLLGPIAFLVIRELIVIYSAD